jgi:hypothetical protein
MDNCQTFIICLLVLYILLFLLVSQKKTKEDFAPIVDNIEIGTIYIGPGQPFETKTFDFNNKFNKAPHVFLEPLYGDDVPYTDVFSTSIQMITPESCRFNIQRIDDPTTAWGQHLKMMYVAIEPQRGTPYENIGSISKWIPFKN